MFEFLGTWIVKKDSVTLSAGHAAAIILVKLRLLFDIQALLAFTRVLRSRLPQGITDLIYTKLAGKAFAFRFIPMKGTLCLSNNHNTNDMDSNLEDDDAKNASVLGSTSEKRVRPNV